MKTSIIIPYHRGEAYLRDCLDSLREQSGIDMEILLICDHVNEKELECVKDYEHALPIQIYHLQASSGVAAARNLGIEKATGDYIYFLDSDDYLMADTLGLLIQSAQLQDYDIIYGKKSPTWLSRIAYLSSKQEPEAGDEEREREASDNEAPELQAEHGATKEKHSKAEASSEEENSEEDESDETQVDKDVEDDIEVRLDLQRSADLEADEANLTDEELQALIDFRRSQAYRILVAKRKGVRNISVLNILFNRSFIEKHHLRFPEHLIYLSDVPFLLEALSKAESFCKCLSARYIKRKHNDAINFPSLSQVKDPNRFYEFVDTYYETTARIPKDSELKDHFDIKYITYYTRVYAPKLKRSPNDAWREENFISMSDIISQVNPRVLKVLKGYKRLIIQALIRRDLKASIYIVTLHLGVKKFKRVAKSRKAMIRALYTHVFLKQELKENWILFESFFGKNYSDSPKYIYEYMAKNYPGKYKFIWVIDKPNTRIPYPHKEIKRFSLLYSYYLARCKYFVFNGRQPEWMVKRKEMVFLETWHGTPLKKLVFDMDDVTSASPKYKQQVYKQSRAWDYLIAPNKFSSETFRRCFMYENKMLETGYPRNDILHDPKRNELAKKIRRRLGIPENKVVLLYAPTWRDDEFYGKGQYKFKLQLDLDLMQKRLGENYVILLRTHYFIADSLDVRAYRGFAYNVSKYDDISELYLISDILITDYSSVFFDYANLRRPMLFFTYDLERYRDVLRGFYFDIEKEVPGPLLYTTEEVVNAIRNIDAVNREYSQRYNDFYGRFCGWEDGHATRKVVQSVFGSK